LVGVETVYETFGLFAESGSCTEILSLAVPDVQGPSETCALNVTVPPPSLHVVVYEPVGPDDQLNVPEPPLSLRV
jgi:hypothetical protein